MTGWLVRGRRLEVVSRGSISPTVRTPSSLPFLVAGLVLLAGPALAGCTDPPAPGVEWRRCLLDSAELAGADLSRAHLRDASFQRAVLRGARLAGADAQNARFVSAAMAGADLTGAVLRSADFTRADLKGARLAGADLRRATLFRADLSDADLTGADLGGANLAGALLGGARWTDGRRICAAGSVGNCQ